MNTSCTPPDDEEEIIERDMAEIMERIRDKVLAQKQAFEIRHRQRIAEAMRIARERVAQARANQK